MDEKSKQVIVRYTGECTKIKVGAWLQLFEVVIKSKKLDTDEAKVTLLMSYLDKEALQWFAEDIVSKLDDITWEACKLAMIQRFDQQIVEPVLAAQRRRLQRGETVKDYHEAKMVFLRASGLNQHSMCDLLTDGMPFSFRTPLIAAKVLETKDWLSIAVQLESSFGSRFNSGSTSQGLGGQQLVAVNANFTDEPASRNKQFKSKKKPPSPCMHCKTKGKVEWHWNSDCPDKPVRPASVVRPSSNATVMTAAAENY